MDMRNRVGQVPAPNAPAVPMSDTKPRPPPPDWQRTPEPPGDWAPDQEPTS